MVKKKTKARKTKLVCAKCRVDWRSPGSPAICPVCKESSFAISVEKG